MGCIGVSGKMKASWYLAIAFVIFIFFAGLCGSVSAEQRCFDYNKTDCFDAEVSQKMQLEIEKCREMKQLLKIQEEKIALQQQIIDHQKELLVLKDDIISAKDSHITALKAANLTKELTDIINVQRNVISGLEGSKTQQTLRGLPILGTIIILLLAL